MAKKKKLGFDMSKMKEFLIAKGERVGLIVAAALMVLLLLSGIWMSVGAQSTHKKVISQAQSLRSRVNSTMEVEQDEKVKNKLADGSWGETDPSLYAAGGWFDAGSIDDDKVNNPFVLPLVGSQEKGREKAKYMQVDIVRSPVFVNEISGGSVKTITGASFASDMETGTETGTDTRTDTFPGAGATTAQTGPQLARYVEPRRLVVVSALFPYQKQLEVFQRALRKNTIQEVAFNPKIAPKFLGINVIRTEVRNGRIVGDWTKLFYADSKKKSPEVLKDWKEFFSLAVFDQKSHRQVAKYVRSGLVTPLPKLAYGTYPKLNLPSIEVADKSTSETGMEFEPDTAPGSEMYPGMEAPGGSLPGVDLPEYGMTGGGGSKVEISNIGLKTLAKKDEFTYKKLLGQFNFFDPMGKTEDAKKALGSPMYPGGADYPGAPGAPGEGMPGEEMPGMPGEEMPGDMGPGGMGMGYQIPEHLLVRFVDVSVEAGKTYKYYVQIRLENPNYKQKDKVAYPAQAEVKELLSPWTETPAASLEDEYDYYIVDQHVIDPKSILHITKDTDVESVRTKPEAELKYKTDAIPVQVHRWVLSAYDPVSKSQYQNGDWAIADRLLVKRGQRIGETSVEVQMPVWDEKKVKFGLLPPDKNKKRKMRIPPEYKRTQYEVPLQTGVAINFRPEEQAPLVVDFKGGEWKFQTHDGIYTKSERAAINVLVVTPDGRLLAHDSRTDTDPSTERGAVRAARYEYWRTLIDALTPKTTVAIPGVEGPGMDPGGGILDCGDE